MSFMLKKLAAFLITGLVPLMAFILLAFTTDFIVAALVAILLIFVCYWVGNMLLKNPFLDMLEGKGSIAFVMDAYGIIFPFIAHVVKKPFIEGIVNGKKVESYFDREGVNYIAPPMGMDAYEDDTFLYFKVEKKYMSKNSFPFGQYSAFLYNEQMGRFINKDFFDLRQKQLYVTQELIYLRNKLEELQPHIRDFSRSTIDLLRPVTNFLAQNFPIMLLILAVILVVLFGPQISGFLGGAGSAIAPGVSSAVVTPNA